MGVLRRGHNHAPSAGRISPGVVLAIGAVGLAGFLGPKACDKVFNAVVPHKDAMVESQAALHDLTLPAETILVKGKGSASTQLDIRPVSHAPLGAGWVFNHTVAKVTGNRTGVERAGSIQIVAGAVGNQRPSMKLSPYTIQGTHTKADGKIGIHADIDITQLSSQTANMRKVKSWSDPDVFDVSTASDIANYASTMDDTADAFFRYSCGTALTRFVEFGAQKFVRGYVRSAGALESATNAHSHTLIDLSSPDRPVDVSFVKSYILPGGQPKYSPVSPDAISISDIHRPTSETVAKQLGKSTEDVHLDTGASGAKSCAFDGKALDQAVALLSRQTVTTPTQVGV